MVSPWTQRLAPAIALLTAFQQIRHHHSEFAILIVERKVVIHAGLLHAFVN